jgi:hypothetical protein
VDTIDAGDIDLSFLGHGYVADTRAVLTDMYYLLHRDDGPDERAGLGVLTDSVTGKEYWAFRA